MRKILIISLIIAIWPSIVLAEKIDGFFVDILIDQDSSINITERIDYDFEELERHGIYRDIPVKYDARGGSYNLRLKVLGVEDESGNTYTYSVSQEGKNKRIKIGDADRLVGGKQSYLIHYRVERAINFFDDHDELYWNTTGNEWQVPIMAVESRVEWYKDMDEGGINYECYEGSLASTQECGMAGFEESGGVVMFNSYNLERGEGQTIVIVWPKGEVVEPSFWDKLLDILKDNGILFLPVLVLLGMIYIWRRYGKDPEGRGTIIPEYEAPKGVSPAEAGMIIDERVDNKDISAEIVHLAVLGYLKIRRIEGKGIFKRDDYELSKLKDVMGTEKKHQRLLMEGLFGGKNAVKLSALKDKFYEDLKEIQDELRESLTQGGYFPKDPKKVRLGYMMSGVAVAMLGIFVVGMLMGPLAIVSFVLSGLVIVIFSFFMPLKSRQGVLAREAILGLKMYLGVAEKERLKFHNAPKKDPESFEKLLPYAMVLGVEKEWAASFKGIYNQAPSWYSDAAGRGAFNALYLTGALGDFRSSAVSILSSRPSSAAGGGSGMSGGFSGGGFGGGGGGSW